jgi:hypothetical protein
MAAVLEPWGLLNPSGSTAKEGSACGQNSTSNAQRVTKLAVCALVEKIARRGVSRLCCSRQLLLSVACCREKEAYKGMSARMRDSEMYTK